jgi:hypothetical protein
MKPLVVGALLAVVALMVCPATVRAQEANLTGTITDSTGAVLPGVTVTALHEASGNTFVGITDERGNYRLTLRTGVFAVTADLTGFARLTRRFELAVGQQGVLNLQMAPSTVEESVTVTSQAPLVDVTQSKVSGIIDTRQMQEIPSNGRNWMQLTMLAPGSRANAAQDAPVQREGTSSAFQMNVDGQQVSDVLSSSGSAEPRFSRDSIAEFELITNRFDATQGRSSGVQVNAVTKSGTNLYSGSGAGYFRSDSFNAADFVVHQVLPYSDQQFVVTFGGPFKKDRAHFFGHYEGEREPQTIAFTSPFPAFNIPPLTATRTEKKFGLRIDTQFTAQSHLMLKGTRWTHTFPFNLPRFQPGATLHPSGVGGGNQSSDQLWSQYTQTLGSKAVNELKGGYTSLHFDFDYYSNFARTGDPSGVTAQSAVAGAAKAPGLLIPLDGDPPAILLRGYTLGNSVGDYPQNIGQDAYQIRDNLTWYLSAIGTHGFKIGGEYIYLLNHLYWDNLDHSVIDAQGGPIPANIQDLFPVWNDWRTWNLAPLSPVVRFYRRTFGSYIIYDPRDTAAAWAQDDWQITKRLTFNLGLRYDVSLGSLGDRVPALPPFRLAQNIHPDLWNFGPRLGFAYAVADRTVLRGGYGRFYAEPLDNPVHWSQMSVQTVVPTTLNDGRPNFAADPYNGQVPTKDSIIASGARRDLSANIIPGNDNSPGAYHTMYSEMASVGLQRQIGDTMSATADYVFTGSRREIYARNANLSYNPATGANYSFTDLSHLPYPNWGLVPAYYADGYSNYHGLQTAFTKRMSSNWQLSATYTLSGFWDAVGAPGAGFPVNRDLGGWYTLAATDQRHRAVVNGIWQLKYGFELSGLYFYGSGLRYATTYGGDLRNAGTGAGGNNFGMLRPDGTIVPRNNFVGLPIHRVDLRLQRRFPIYRHAAVDGIFEMFNAFNHANYGSYTTAEVLPTYAQPAQNVNVAYQPRMLQLGFRVTF